MFLGDLCGSGYYRVLQPYRMLAQRYPEHEICISNLLCGADIQQADVVVLQSIHHPETLQFVLSQKKSTTRIIYDLDDLLHRMHPSNPSYAQLPPHHLQAVLYFLQYIDCLTVATEPLKAFYKKHAPRVEVLPNVVLGAELFRVDHPPHPVTLGWTGSAHHHTDWQSFLPILVSVMKAHPEVHFTSVGSNYTWMLKNCGIPAERHHYVPGTLEVQQDFFLNKMHLSHLPGYRWVNGQELWLQIDQEKKQWVPLELTEEVPWPVPLYYDLLRSTPIDIGVIPLSMGQYDQTEREFNEAKSNIKAREMGMCGIPVVASAMDPYLSYFEHLPYYKAKQEGWGFLCQDPAEWKNALHALIESEYLRSLIGSRARERACADSPESVLDRYRALFQEVRV